VIAAVQAIREAARLPGQLPRIVDALRPADETARGQGGDLVDRTVRAQIRRTVEEPRRNRLLAAPARQAKLEVVGGYYSLDTGRVGFVTTRDRGLMLPCAVGLSR
jgi:carbonic anhydrase